MSASVHAGAGSYNYPSNMNSYNMNSYNPGNYPNNNHPSNNYPNNNYSNNNYPSNNYQNNYSNNNYSNNNYQNNYSNNNYSNNNYSNNNYSNNNYSNNNLSNNYSNDASGYGNQPAAHPASQPKHVLYYSNHCGYSRAVCDKIHEGGLRDHFMGVCVDHMRGEIPAFVKCVPTILTMDRRVLVDDQVKHFVEHMNLQRMGTPESNVAATAAADSDVLPGFAAAHAFTDQFAVLDTCAEFSIDDHHTFESFNNIADQVGAANQQACDDSSAQATSSMGKPPKLDAKEIEMYMASREIDISEAKRFQANGPPPQTALPHHLATGMR